MKRFTILAIMALFLMGTVATASAVELKASGSWRANANWWNQNGIMNKDNPKDSFNVKQRARTKFDFIANENLKGVLYTEIGDFAWGHGAGSVGGDSTEAFKIKNAYLDFNIPNTEVNIKAGLQGLQLPGFVGGSPLFDDDVAGLTFSAPITDMVGITGGWARLQDYHVEGEHNNGTDGFDDNGDNVDLGFLATPLTFDGVQVVPYFGYVWAGKPAKQLDDDGDPNAWFGVSSNEQDWMDDVWGIAEDVGATGKADAWYFGVPVQVSMFDPLVVSGDFHYGHMKIDAGDGAGNDDVKMQGWLADLAVEYKMDMMTPMVFASYATGLDENDVKDDQKLGVYPGIDGYWAVDTMLTDGGAFTQDLWLANPVSMWTMGARLKDMSFVEDLTHEVGIIYARGTSDKEVANFAGVGTIGAGGPDAPGFLNKGESIWAADFVTRYQIYENLAAIAELGYAKYNADFDNDLTTTAKEDDWEDNIYKGVVGLEYSF